LDGKPQFADNWRTFPSKPEARASGARRLLYCFFGRNAFGGPVALTIHSFANGVDPDQVKHGWLGETVPPCRRKVEAVATTEGNAAWLFPNEIDADEQGRRAWQAMTS
jgi:hypothetical protein